VKGKSISKEEFEAAVASLESKASTLLLNIYSGLETVDLDFSHPNGFFAFKNL